MTVATSFHYKNITALLQVLSKVTASVSFYFEKR